MKGVIQVGKGRGWAMGESHVCLQLAIVITGLTKEKGLKEKIRE